MRDKKGMKTGGKNFGYCTDLGKFVKGRLEQPGQSLCSRKAKRLDVQPPLQRGVKPHGAAAAWLRKLGPPRTVSERTFRHCVSPSIRRIDRSSGAVHPSQVAGGYTVQPMGKRNSTRARLD
jgi:hypothetical protein